MPTAHHPHRMSPDGQMVFHAIMALARDGREFTTDDVWPLLERAPAERNVVGSGFRHAAADGIIVGTERFIRSTRPESKGRRVQVWRGQTAQPALEL